LGGWKVGAENFLAVVLQPPAQPVWVVDADRLIRFANPAAIAALGSSAAAFRRAAARWWGSPT